MNLKVSKQSKFLVGMYIDELAKDHNLAACLHSIANQTNPVDLVIFTQGLTAEEVGSVKELANSPYLMTISRDDKGQAVENKISSNVGVNFEIIEVEQPMNLAQIFNTTFNLARYNNYEFISFVEAEDGFSAKWFEIANKYAEENPSIGIFTPLIRNMTGGVFAGIMNEAPWAEHMQAEQAGKFDLNMLQRFNCVNPLGAVYKIKPILEYSEKDSNDTALPMKESMKLSHYYEFFLRMIYDAVEIMTIPRIGYELKTVRKQKFNDSTCKIPQDLAILPPDRGGISPDEGRFWFDLAKKEFYHDVDRKKAYAPSI